MRIAILSLAALGLASTAAAQQMPLPAFSNTFTASLTRGFWFQAPAAAVITGLAVPNEAGQPFQVVEVIDLGLVPPPAFPGTITGTQLFYDNMSAGGSIIPCAVPLVAGNYYGVLGACNDSQGSATSYNSYGPNGPFTSNFLGIATDITRFGTQSGIASNGGNQPCWQEAAFNVSRVEVYLSGGGGGTIATNELIGDGCVSEYQSVYEDFAPGSFDLNNTAITFLDTGGTYAVTQGGSYNAVGSVGTPMNLTLTDDSQVDVSTVGGTTGITVGSNGWIAFGNGNSNAFTPSVATFLSNPNPAFHCWRDINPAAAGGPVVYEEDANGNAQITFDGTFNFGGTGPGDANFIQFQVSAGGDVVIAWQTQPTGGTGTIVGYSPGGANLDPGEDDLSEVANGNNVILTGAMDVVPLSMAGVTRPVLGTNWDLSVNDIPASTVFGVTIFGTTDPAILDLGFLGLPECQLRASLDLVDGPWTPAGASFGVTFPIPATPTSLIGFEVYTQAATFGVPPVNAFGAITSNGVKGTLGDL